MEVRFWGTRGSIPTPGSHTVRFGGNTSCVEVRTAEGHIFIFDCGTGARPLGEALMAPPVAPVSASILFSHTHWDHIQGFPFFAPAFEPRNTIAVYGPEGGRRSLHDTLARQMELSYFPVELSQRPARSNRSCTRATAGTPISWPTPISSSTTRSTRPRNTGGGRAGGTAHSSTSSSSRAQPA